MVARRVLIGLPLLALVGCDKSSPSESGDDRGAPELIALNGAGATFPYPLYSKWMAEYNRLYPQVRINYQSIGSGGGIRQIVAGTVDFGASDAPMKDAEGKQAPGKLTHVPTTIGSVVVAYNLPGVGGLNLSGEQLAAIVLGDVKKWNDPRLVEANPDSKLPDQDIAVVFRTDGSGTTAVFTEYLATVSPAFKEKVGAGKSVRWPVGLGAKGNEGVTGQIKSTPGAVGYVELAYATQNKLPTAAIKNRAGRFIAPSSEAASAAASGVEMPDSLHVSLAEADGEQAYPIAAYTYLLVYEDAKDGPKGQALARFLWWALHDGQKFAQALDYAPLPKSVVTKVEAKLKRLTFGGKPLLDAI